MVRPWSSQYIGRLEELDITSQALEANPLGDSPTRPLYVYLPPGYDDDLARRYPSVYVLQGFFGAVPGWKRASNNLRPSYIEMADELFASGDVPPCIVVFVDAWTRSGGASSSTPPPPAATTPTCARTSSPSSTRDTGPSRRRPTAVFRASPPAASEP